MVTVWHKSSMIGWYWLSMIWYHNLRNVSDPLSSSSPPPSSSSPPPPQCNSVARFDMKDLGPARKILGIDIIRDRSKGTLIMSQKSYLEKVLERFQMQQSKGVQVPMGVHFKLMKASKEQLDKDSEFMKTVSYSSAVGSLMYAMLGTRPDLAYPVGLISRYMSCPAKTHWEAVKWVLRYVRGTTSYCIKFQKSTDFRIVGFCDSDYAADLDKRRSISGYVFKSGLNVINWKSTLQKVVALSTTEAEFMSLNAASKEAIWLRGLSREMGYSQDKCQIFCDSQSAISLAKNQVFHDRTKHMAVKMQFVRDLIDEGDLEVLKIHTVENPADIFTKVLTAGRFKDLLSLLSVITH